MPMRIISADYIYPLNQAVLQRAYLICNDQGTIEDILTEESFHPEPSTVERYQGAISPGFVNTHCHLELSGWENKIPEKIGLDNFIEHINTAYKEKWVYDKLAISNADKKMLQNGIVAVGDISNTSHSFRVKQASKIYYHTFVELFAFDAQKADASMEAGRKLLHKAKDFDLNASISPHAPYSLSNKLMQKIAAENLGKNSLISIHNQESEAENELFLHKAGKMATRLKSYGFDIENWEIPKNYPPAWYLHEFQEIEKILLVHNTFSNQSSIDLVKSLHSNCFWCLCPLANLYIENTLPDVPLFIKNKLKITLGTDSLASNHQLSIAAEMQAIHRQYPEINFETLLQWACVNGAELLNIQSRIGTLEKGKQPGLVLWENKTEQAFNFMNCKAIKVLV